MSVISYFHQYKLGFSVQKDFHHGVIKILARAAGFDEDQASTIAYVEQAEIEAVATGRLGEIACQVTGDDLDPRVIDDSAVFLSEDPARPIHDPELELEDDDPFDIGQL